jgi:hypothetical protein
MKRTFGLSMVSGLSTERAGTTSLELRVSELIGFKPTDIDSDRMFIRVNQSKGVKTLSKRKSISGINLHKPSQ